MTTRTLIFNFATIIVMVFLQGCECTNTSSNYNPPPTIYRAPTTPSYKPDNILTQEQIQRLLNQVESDNIFNQPIQRRRFERSDDWERGYNYGYDVGYEDAVNRNGAWASYDDSGKGGDFLDGYESGYIDGYETGKEEFEDKREYDDEDEDEYEEEEIEDL